MLMAEGYVHPSGGRKPAPKPKLPKASAETMDDSGLKPKKHGRKFVNVITGINHHTSPDHRPGRVKV